MKTIINFCAVLLLAASVSLTSCVSKRKYLGSQKRLNTVENENKRVRKDLNACQVNVSSLESESDRLRLEREALQNQNAAMQAEQAKKLKALQDKINAQREAANRLKMSMAEALIGFKPDELSVFILDGNVYVSLEEKLLFPSGSAVINPGGKEAIGKLAAVIKGTPDIHLIVEGHTDNVPIKTEKYNDNWDLSTARANAIVRVLTEDYGVDPKLITASGRGEFHPVKTNATPEGRASNRRTEIILAPDLEELYDLME